MKKSVGGIFLLLLIFSCQPSTPKIAQTFYQVDDHWDPSKKAWSPQLTVFVQALNDDGVEDLDHFNLIHDGARLWWQFNKSQWVKKDHNGEVWVGTQGVNLPLGVGLPLGLWRIQLVTKAGLKAETSFTLLEPRGNKEDIIWERRGDTCELKGFPSSYLVWVYDDKNLLILTRKQHSPRMSLAELLGDPTLKARARSVVFYSYDPDQGRGVTAGPYDLRATP